MSGSEGGDKLNADMKVHTDIPEWMLVTLRSSPTQTLTASGGWPIDEYERIQQSQISFVIHTIRESYTKCFAGP